MSSFSLGYHIDNGKDSFKWHPAVRGRLITNSICDPNRKCRCATKWQIRKMMLTESDLVMLRQTRKKLFKTNNPHRFDFHQAFFYKPNHADGPIRTNGKKIWLEQPLLSKLAYDAIYNVGLPKAFLNRLSVCLRLTPKPFRSSLGVRNYLTTRMQQVGNA